MDYLIQVSPLQYYSKTNIGSRPTKRGSGKITMQDLRAVPFVGSWSQLKQNVTGYFGVGTALAKMEKLGKLSQLKTLYQKSLFFKTLIDNCEMAMKKCFFPLTAYLSRDEKFGEIWTMIRGHEGKDRVTINYDSTICHGPIKKIRRRKRSDERNV